MDKEDTIITVALTGLMILLVIIIMVLAEAKAKRTYYWVTERYEPVVKITTVNGVQDTIYGYMINEIIE